MRSSPDTRHVAEPAPVGQNVKSERSEDFRASGASGILANVSVYGKFWKLPFELYQCFQNLGEMIFAIL